MFLAQPTQHQQWHSCATAAICLGPPRLREPVSGLTPLCARKPSSSAIASAASALISIPGAKWPGPKR